MKYLAHATSSIRIVIAPLIYLIIVNAEYLVAFFLFSAAIISDLLDGYIARKFNTTSRFGELYDASCDAVLILAIFFSLWKIGKILGWIPVACILIMASLTIICYFTKGKYSEISGKIGKLFGAMIGFGLWAYLLSLTLWL